MGYRVENIYFIWLLAILPVIIILFLCNTRWKRRVARNTGDAALVKKMSGNYNPRNFLLKFVLTALAITLGILAVLNFTKPSGTDGIKRKGIDVVFALDVSRSMLATDISPSRLERAKQFITEMMQALPGSRTGIVLFAGKAYLQMPLSADHAAAEMMINEASPDAVPVKGTIISEALKESLNAFGDYDGKYKAVILISDGEDHEEEAQHVAKELATHGLMLNTVGIGSPQGSLIPDTTGGNKTDENGQPVISKLNEAGLQQLAANANGVYVHLQQTAPAVKTMAAALAKIDKKVMPDSTLMHFTYYYWWFLGAMLILLVAAQLLPEKKIIK